MEFTVFLSTFCKVRTISYEKLWCLVEVRTEVRGGWGKWGGG